MMSNRLSFAFLASALTVYLSAPASAYAIRYVPFLSAEGYREIRLEPDLYYVAFHATMASDANEIDAAWSTRAAELCYASGNSHFVELRYSFEPVLKGDRPVLGMETEQGGRLILTKGSTYVPIFIPRAHGVTPVNAPGKQAHVRCVKDPSAALDAKRLMDAAKIVQEGKARGWVGTRAK